MPSDLKTFRRVTMGKPVVMGRRTFATLPKPLDGRDNIVVTRDPKFAAEGVTVAASLDEALTVAGRFAKARGVDEIMVIGGGEIYRAVLPAAHRIYWTRIHGVPEGDTSFPPLDLDQWQRVSSEPIPTTDRDQYKATLEIIERTPQSRQKP